MLNSNGFICVIYLTQAGRQVFQACHEGAGRCETVSVIIH